MALELTAGECGAASKTRDGRPCLGLTGPPAKGNGSCFFTISQDSRLTQIPGVMWGVDSDRDNAQGPTPDRRGRLRNAPAPPAVNQDSETPGPAHNSGPRSGAPSSGWLDSERTRPRWNNINSGLRHLALQRTRLPRQLKPRRQGGHSHNETPLPPISNQC